MKQRWKRSIVSQVTPIGSRAIGTLWKDRTRGLDSFSRSEILDVLPPDSREILSILSVSDRPVPWEIIAKAEHDGPLHWSS